MCMYLMVVNSGRNKAESVVPKAKKKPNTKKKRCVYVYTKSVELFMCKWYHCDQ